MRTLCNNGVTLPTGVCIGACRCCTIVYVCVPKSTLSVTPTYTHIHINAECVASVAFITLRCCAILCSADFQLLIVLYFYKHRHSMYVYMCGCLNCLVPVAFNCFVTFTWLPLQAQLKVKSMSLFVVVFVVCHCLSLFLVCLTLLSSIWSRNQNYLPLATCYMQLCLSPSTSTSAVFRVSFSFIVHACVYMFHSHCHS